MIRATEEMTCFTFKKVGKTRESYSVLCGAFGLSMSAATLALVRQAVRSQSMTFSMRDANGNPDMFSGDICGCLGRTFHKDRKGS